MTASQELIFPYDILSEIAEKLCDSKHALGAFALSCRILHSASRRHIFRRIVLKDRTKLDEFLSLLKASPEIAPWVNELRFVVRDGQTVYAVSMTSTHWLFHAASSLPRILPQLHVLEMHGLHLTQSPLGAVLADKFSSCTALRKLSLSAGYFPKSFLSYMLCALPGISSLTLSSVALLCDSQVVALPEPRKVQLRFLECDEYDAVLNRIITTFSENTIRTLVVNKNGPTTTGELVPLLGSSLEHLVIVIRRRHWERPASPEGVVDLRRSSNIRQLEFRHCPMNLSTMLLQLPCPELLQELSFVLDSYDWKNVNEDDFKDLDDCITRHFPSVQRVQFTTVQRDSQVVADGMAGKMLHQLLPAVAAEGILHVNIVTVQGHDEEQNAVAKVQLPQYSPPYQYGFPGMRYH
ncbi:unnamed protein product [Somion occarium]|uniref:F-box domain-containing protein n=1 Tax=Somion occarium TaxID=3059160 RepID=A0ABP1E2Z6_9APHY